MKTTTFCAVAFLFAVTSSAFAVSVDRDITADYVKANPKEFTVSVTEKANGLLAFTVVFTTPDPRYVVAHLVVRDSEKIYATSDTPSFTKNRSNTFHFSIPRDLVATSTFSLGVSGFADSDDEAVPRPGTITNKLQLLDFVPQKVAGIKGATFHLNSGEDFLVDKETVIAKLANVVQDEAAPSTLKAAVAKFNQETRTHPIGKSQLPLTEDEVIAAIRGWIPAHTPDVTDKIYNAFQEIAESRKLPPDGAELSFRADWTGYRGYRFDVWRIDLTIATGENDACLFRIRDQKISSRKMTAEELTEEQAAIKAPLEAR